MGVQTEVSPICVVSILVAEGVISGVYDRVWHKAKEWELVKDGTSKMLYLNLL